MADYYIRTPEQDESRGPFDISKLVTLAEAGQINQNTLYYDEDKEEWAPIVQNEQLQSKVFPKKEKLELKIHKPELVSTEPENSSDNQVESILAAAEGNTAEKRKITRKKKSFNRAAHLSATGLGIMMILSALVMIIPLISIIQGAMEEHNLLLLINYPTFLIGIFDLILGVILLLAVTEVFPLLRGRSMLTLGFGVYVAWAIGDPLLMGLSASAGLGIFMASLSQGMTTMLLAYVLGIGGNAYLAFLALNGRFDEFVNVVVFNIVSSS